MPYIKKDFEMIVCIGCGESFTPRHSSHKYCTKECSHKSTFSHLYSHGYKSKDTFSTSTTGAAHELIVCADLMKKGYDVFRAQSPSCSCDLVVLKGTSILRIEVRTGTRKIDGKVSYSFKPTDLGRSDILAIVTHDWDILYYNTEPTLIDM